MKMIKTLNVYAMIDRQTGENVGKISSEKGVQEVQATHPQYKAVKLNRKKFEIELDLDVVIAMGACKIKSVEDDIKMDGETNA